MKKNIFIICRCEKYQLIDSSKLELIENTLKASNREFVVLSDFCKTVATDRDKLKSYNILGIVGCACSALRSLCDYGKIECAKFYNLRDNSAEDILEEMAIEVALEPNTECEKILDDSSWIAWYPVIDREKCVNCGKCIDFCIFGVYAKDEHGVIKVDAPSNCKTNCPACARVCPKGAIIFPKYKEAPINGGEVIEVKEKTMDSDLYSKLAARRLKNRKINLFKEDQ